jgi:phosphoribosyl-ATP pyrophosphohydrolase/phosphoribosyl-AMP cyclohydrolase
MKNTLLKFAKLDLGKMQDLLPAIIQDVDTLQVLMLGYMNKSALEQTIATNTVTFYSRSRESLWVKGETSGNFLQLVEIIPDCDNDALLVLVKPMGVCCHLNKTSCFGEKIAPGIGFLAKLNKLIAERYRDRPQDSYTTKLFAMGTQRIAQKVGEEGIELALAAMAGKPAEITAESADLIFHVLVLLKQCDVDLAHVLTELQSRHKQ